MTSERRVMELFERANPIPDPDTYRVEPDLDRIMATHPDRVPKLGLDSASEPPRAHRRTWMLPAVAAAAVAIVVVGLLVLVPESESTPSVDSPSTAPPSSEPVTDRSVIEGFFDAYNTGDVETLLAGLTDDFVLSKEYDASEPDPDSAPLSRAQQRLTTRLERGERLRDHTCAAAASPTADTRAIRCEYVTDQLAEDADSSPIPTRTLFIIDDGKISEIHQNYGDPADFEYAFGRWVFLDYPDMWAPLFAATDSQREATEQRQLRTQWFERFTEECGRGDRERGTCGTDAAGPTMPSAKLEELHLELTSIQWTPGCCGYSDRPDCDPPFSRGYIDGTRLDEGARGSLGFPYRRAGFANLFADVWPNVSPDQAQIVLDQLAESISCFRADRDPEVPVERVEELPQSVPAHGFIVNDNYSIFTVTNPRGGLVWMYLRDGPVTLEIVAELAEVAGAFLDEVMP